VCSSDLSDLGLQGVILYGLNLHERYFRNACLFLKRRNCVALKRGVISILECLYVAAIAAGECGSMQ